MADYTKEDRERLGRAIRKARKRFTEYRDTQDWADALDRSDRVVLAMERGEKVGDDTISRAEAALGWPEDHAFRMLADPKITAPPHPAAPTTEQRAAVQALADAYRFTTESPAPERAVDSVVELLRVIRRTPEGESRDMLLIAAHTILGYMVQESGAAARIAAQGGIGAEQPAAEPDA